MSQAKNKKRNPPKAKLPSVPIAKSVGKPSSKQSQFRSQGSVLSNLSVIPTVYDSRINRVFNTQEISLPGGGKGLRMSGLYPAASIYVSAGNATAPLVYFGTTTQSTILYVDDTLLAQNNSTSLEYNTFTRYARYMYTKLRLHYQGTFGTNTQGSFYLGYFPDGSVASADITSVALVSNLPCAGKSNIWSPHTIWDFSASLPKSDWFFVDADVQSDAGSRQSFQGAIAGYWQNRPQNPGVGDINGATGDLWIEYSVDLIEPYGVFNIALAREKERKLSMKLDVKEHKQSPSMGVQQPHLESDDVPPSSGPPVQPVQPLLAGPAARVPSARPSSYLSGLVYGT
jgi:hypothetical protein